MSRNKIADAKLYIILLQASSIIIILLTIFIIKQLNLNLFSELKCWFVENFEIKTDIEQVLDDNCESTESGNFVLPENNDEYKENDEVVVTNTVNLEQVKNVLNTNCQSKNSLILPVNGFISSKFGGRPDPFTADDSTHKGLDIAAYMGENIFAVYDGVVSKVGYDEQGYGKYIIIKHSEGFETLYAHCNEIISKEGQKVIAGDIIAKVGSTGRSTGSHLHFEMRINNIAIDPEMFLGEL